MNGPTVAVCFAVALITNGAAMLCEDEPPIYQMARSKERTQSDTYRVPRAKAVPVLTLMVLTKAKHKPMSTQPLDPHPFGGACAPEVSGERRLTK